MLTPLKMSDDERAIRNVIDLWVTASKEGDIKTVLSLMTDDAIFLVPGQPPFGKDAFQAMSSSARDCKIEEEHTIEELQIMGDWAYLRDRLDITIMQDDGVGFTIHSGYALTILHKEADGRWRLARDANRLVLQ